MKGHEPKIHRMEDILNLPVQDPPCVEFSAAQIKWAKVEVGPQGVDDIALIPFSRVADFVKGESTNVESPANFHIESRQRRREDTGVLMVLKTTEIVRLALRKPQTASLHQGKAAGLGDVICHERVPLSFHVAWVITSCSDGHDIHKRMSSLAERIKTKDPRWGLNAFLVDDPSLGTSIIRDVFQCRVLLCLWGVRRAWIRNLLKKCRNFDLLREMLKYLGCILYCTRSGPSIVDAVEEFMQIYVDQCAFMDYFKIQWLPRIELWENGIRTLPVATQEPLAAIKSYHLRLKSKLFHDPNPNFWPRVDWLIHMLTTMLHSLYRFDQYTADTGCFENLRDGAVLTNSWHQALRIPDADVLLLDEENLQLGKVISQADRNFAYTIWNPGSEFCLCDCSWSRCGNLCKHIIKVAIVCRNRNAGRPLLEAQVYQQSLLSLLQNLPDDPLVLGHAILPVNQLQRETKGFEELASRDLLQPLPPETNSHKWVEHISVFPCLH